MDKKLPVYIDTDIGLGTPGAEIDDGAALIMMLNSQRVDVVGCGSVFGNVPLEDASINLDRIITILGREDIPIAQGAERPLRGDMTWFDDWMADYGQILNWETRSPVLQTSDLIDQLAQEYSGELTILSIGPMTNLAEALAAKPDIQKAVKQVIVMGGSFNQSNALPEFNIRCDPYAAQKVFNADWPLAVFGLEITQKMHFSRRMFSALNSCNPAVQLLRRSSDRWIDRVEKMGWEKDGCSLHDAVAAAYLIQPELFEMTPVDRIMVTTEDGSRYGSTRFTSSDQNEVYIRAAISVQAEACRDLIWSLITKE